ncbi:MAG: VOC family protein [Hyphomicrobiaceae bacterium]|nr:VOC family protein [Hyphomicrobiaceae bacterium]
MSIAFAPPIPILRMFDVEHALRFYRDFLGFAVDWEHRFETGAPLYLQVSRSGVLLHLSEHHGDATPGSAIRIGVLAIEELHASLAVKPYKYARPGIALKPWGQREMTVTDPSGNRIIFFAPA